MATDNLKTKMNRFLLLIISNKSNLIKIFFLFYNNRFRSKMKERFTGKESDLESNHLKIELKVYSLFIFI